MTKCQRTMNIKDPLHGYGSKECPYRPVFNVSYRHLTGNGKIVSETLCKKHFNATDMQLKRLGRDFLAVIDISCQTKDFKC